MSLFFHVSPGTGAAGIQCLGIDHSPRRGGAGKTFDHQPLSKAASWRAIQELNNRHVTNVDLIVSRRRLNHSSSQQLHSAGAAGSLHSDRRRRDMPEALSYASIEHTVRRSKSAPAFTDRYSPTQNFIMNHGRTAHTAEAIGRSTRSPSKNMKRSPSRECSPPASPTSRQISPRTPRLTRSPRNQSHRSLRSVTKEAFIPEAIALATGSVTLQEGAPITPPGEYIVATTLLSEALQQKASRNFEDGLSTVATTASNQSECSRIRMCTSDSSVIDSVPGSARITNAAGFGRKLDKKLARLYEDHIQRMVKEQQKKSMKRAS